MLSIPHPERLQYFRGVMLGLMMYFPLNTAIGSYLDAPIYSGKDIALAAREYVDSKVERAKSSEDACLRHFANRIELHRRTSLLPSVGFSELEKVSVGDVRLKMTHARAWTDQPHLAFDLRTYEIWMSVCRSQPLPSNAEEHWKSDPDFQTAFAQLEKALRPELFELHREIEGLLGGHVRLRQLAAFLLVIFIVFHALQIYHALGLPVITRQWSEDIDDSLWLRACFLAKFILLVMVALTVSRIAWGGASGPPFGEAVLPGIGWLFFWWFLHDVVAAYLAWHMARKLPAPLRNIPGAANVSRISGGVVRWLAVDALLLLVVVVFFPAKANGIQRWPDLEWLRWQEIGWIALLFLLNFVSLIRTELKSRLREVST